MDSLATRPLVGKVAFCFSSKWRNMDTLSAGSQVLPLACMRYVLCAVGLRNQGAVQKGLGLDSGLLPMPALQCDS